MTNFCEDCPIMLVCSINEAIRATGLGGHIDLRWCITRDALNKLEKLEEK